MTRVEPPFSPIPLLAACLALAAPGCNQNQSPKGEQPRPAAKALAKHEVARGSDPTEAGGGRSVAGVTPPGDLVSPSLAVIQARLRAAKFTYDVSVAPESDLKTLLERAKPRLGASRSECDTLLRSAEQLRDRLSRSQERYTSAAKAYRQRAGSRKEPGLEDLDQRLAEHFGGLATDVPQRIELVDRLIKELRETKALLSETGRDLEAAELAIAVSPPAETSRTAVRETPASSPAPRWATRRPAAAGASAGGDVAADRGDVLRASRRPVSTDRAMYGASGAASVPPDPFPAGTSLLGEITTPAWAFRTPVSLHVLGRSGDAFDGVMHYGVNASLGRRGVRGRVSADGRHLTIWAEWYDGNISPEPIQYELTRDGSAHTGWWHTPTLRGTIRLEPGPA